MTTTSILIIYQDEPVALVNRRHRTLVGHAAELPAGHPLVRAAVWMALYAHLVIMRRLPGPYTDTDAQRFACAALIGPHELAQHADHEDQWFATRFCVPTEQIRPAREETHAPGGGAR